MADAASISSAGAAIRKQGTTKYAENLDYLVASIIYLGSSRYWWGRSVSKMALELSLDEAKLQSVLEGFPGLFRRSRGKSKGGETYYSLQARYAQWESQNGEEPVTDSDIPPLPPETLKMLLDFIQKMAEHEVVNWRTWLTIGFSILTAVIAGLFAIAVAVMKSAPPT